MIFFSRQEKLLQRVKEKSRKLKMNVIKHFLVTMAIFMVIFCLTMSITLWKLINFITEPVIKLYEMLKFILEKGKGNKTKLSYEASNEELNNLNKAFNRIATTM